jgi:hypothetical protein
VYELAIKLGGSAGRLLFCSRVSRIADSFIDIVFVNGPLNNLLGLDSRAEEYTSRACWSTLNVRAASFRTYTSVLLSVPTCSTHTRTTSPDFRNSFLAKPTPAGVPVRIKSPG